MQPGRAATGEAKKTIALDSIWLPVCRQ